MKQRCAILILLILLPLSGINAQVLRGTVKDSGGEPLAYASVYITELRQGTTTNQEGLYELTIPSGTYTVNYQFLGYTPTTERIEIEDIDVRRDITLSEQYYEIPAVRVSASGKDPAYFIMRKAIGMASFHLNQVKMYRAEVYIKGGGKIEKLPKMIRRQMDVEANDAQIEEGKFYFTESVNIITFTAPGRYVHKVISSRSNIPVSDSQTSPMDYLQASFYQPVIAEITISPLAPNAFSHYNFAFMGSTSQGDFVIDKIKVTPKRKSQQLFEGVLFIVEDLWAIHSLDLTNENMAGLIRIKQLYTPVEEGIWMPVSHEFGMDLSLLGIKARGSYSSAVKYLEVQPDRSLLPPSGNVTTASLHEKQEIKTETRKEIEKLISKDELTTRDMSRLAKLNEKNAAAGLKEKSLEITENTSYEIADDALGKDSLYWDAIRPIPLTSEEALSLPRTLPDSLTLARREGSTVTINIGVKSENKKKSPARLFMKYALTGNRWQLSKETSLSFGGLADIKSASFNTVDGFIIGTGMSLSTKTGEKGRLTLDPSVKYAFSRERLMWTVSANLLYDPMTSGSFFIRGGNYSKDFSPVGVNPFLNSWSSLFFRDNWMKLYNSTFIIAGHRGDLANGLNLMISAMWERREVLENTTSFSFFSPENVYTVNVPDNPFIAGEVEGEEAIIPVNHSNASFTAELTYTPRQRYRIRNGAKISAGSDYPTFRVLYMHGYNYNDTLSGHFDFLKAEISRSKQFAALSEFRWRLSAGGFINGKELQIQDLYFFNTQASPLLLNSYEDAFNLQPYYSVSSRGYFAEAHIRYTTPYLLMKRLPGLSRTLMRENLSTAMLWTPHYGFYAEAGYTISEIFLMAEAGIYVGFHDWNYESLGFRVILNFR
ncbi:MAG TPA: DUF5686 and carboxypeptidase regulatory-like domain-containing protein [Bacteroidales bacterium]|nr:DUF5686 and carboxypeptidase regulatory-like domain-containing protein [Bacteroidales bacterium]